MVVDGGVGAIAFLLARVLFGGLLAFQGFNHFTSADAMTGYAEANGLPAPRLGVLGSGAVLVAGGLGIALGVFPAIAAGLLAGFLLVVTPIMHDFWAAPEDQRQSEQTAFIKNVELFAGALVFLVLALGEPWAYAVNVGL
ncbi:DoxX family protein [Halosolutus amylolyticus]|uniref:DoxX family protein n=1 Tax=Halosolutus amylolyticus TaxID=2932267 RepID=A0ABD5PSF8_9EURY|nr:DoxX family protein [Halosolutus amylolyticus]